ncbi:MAG: guanylate kinase [Synergistaceae bacterium]|nr:guanylate kinase [Synergistaceae bacterium]
MKSSDDSILENSSKNSDTLPEKGKKLEGKGTLFIISGPSGVGKGTLCKSIMDIGNISISVSCTTRSPREGEVDGVDYRFISVDEFNKKLDQSLFLEHALVHGDMYGTLRGEIDMVLESGDDMILEIDVQGAFQVKRMMDCVSVFVLPPSIEALEERIHKRNADSEEKIELRMRNAQYEISRAGEFDFSIVNDLLDNAVLDLKKIIIDNRNLSRRV